MVNKERVSERIANQKRRRKFASIILVAILALLLLFFGLAAYQEFTGSFTINLDYREHAKGLSLADNGGLLNPTSRLQADPVKEMDNITWSDFTETELQTLDAKDGTHHGEPLGAYQSNLYFCYSFYVHSRYELAQNYTMRLTLNGTTKGAHKAVRVALWEDMAEGEQEGATGYYEYEPANRHRKVTRYAAPAADGSLERSFADESFYSSTTVFLKVVKGFETNKVRKYTLLIYLEGEDPECTDDIMGGAVKMRLDMEVLSDEELDNFMLNI